jgi:hypothetical protein
MTSEAQKKAKKKWETANYDSIRLWVPKGDREKIKAFAKERGQSLNGFITSLIYDTISKPRQTL